MSSIKKVIPHEDYCLEVFLDNGSSVILDMKNRLHTIRFGVLSDKELFYRATTDGCYIKWSNVLEISINEVFQLIQK